MDERVMSEPEQVAEEFLQAFESSGNYLRGHIARLATLATSEDRETAELATGAVFTSLVERLADSFDPRAVSLYNRAFAQLIQHCREMDQSGALTGELTRFGLATEDELVARAESRRHNQSPALPGDARLEIERVIVLSRVTLGADVAITSVIIEAMKRACPRAEITLVGGQKAMELFGGDARLSLKEISYRRAGRTLERLLSWIDLLGCVRQLTYGLLPGQYLILDPDSRLTQLGLLPLSRAKKWPEDDYLLFPSREYGSNTSLSLGQLTSAWLNDMFGFEEALFPKVSPARDDLVAAGELMKRIRRERRPVVSINFGVGDNLMKRVGTDFETRLVNHLIQGGATIILDKSAGADEIRRANEVIRNAARTTGILEVNEQSLKTLASSDRIDADLIVWSGRIGMLAALISESDLYIGYDSAGQHIAAALGVPCIDVFAGFSSPRMLDRWRPAGKTEARVVAVDKQLLSDTQAVLSDVLRHVREILNPESYANHHT
jgi:ADP-heptose:LPS heptosyltransferase